MEMWLILNELENEIDRKVALVHEEAKRKLVLLEADKIKIGELREIEKKLSKKGLV